MEIVDVLVLEVVFVGVEVEDFGVFNTFLLLPRAILPQSRGQQEDLAVSQRHGATMDVIR